jgi:hypothetical protein
MGEGGSAVRLRQAVLVARDLEPLVERLRSELGLGEPFRDPGVGQFGLENVVFAIGDCFLEIVSPLRPGTAAGRQLERTGGDGGYMALFDLEDAAAARARAERLGIRTVWEIVLPDISAGHLHPGDMRGTIVSLDQSAPYGSWRWGGPEWTGRIADAGAGSLKGITVAVADPSAVAARWGEVLGVEVDPGPPGPRLLLDGGEVRFGALAAGAAEGVVEIAIELPVDVRGGRQELLVGPARLSLADSPG